jgi:hypothetical protein
LEAPRNFGAPPLLAYLAGSFGRISIGNQFKNTSLMLCRLEFRLLRLLNQGLALPPSVNSQANFDDPLGFGQIGAQIFFGLHGT